MWNALGIAAAVLLYIFCLLPQCGVSGSEQRQECDASSPCEVGFTCSNMTHVCEADNSTIEHDHNTECTSDMGQVAMNHTRDDVNHWVGVLVRWTPELVAGPVVYDVTLRARTSRTSTNFSVVDTNSLQAPRRFNSTVFTWPNLLAFWDYHLTITATATNGNSSQSCLLSFRTQTNYPGLVQDLTIVQDTIIAEEVTISFGCVPDKEENGTIQGYTLRKSLLSALGEVVDEQLFNVTVLSATPTCDNFYTAQAVGGVTVERNYTFAVKAFNQDYSGHFTEAITIYIAPRVPRLSDLNYGVPPLAGSPESITSLDTSIDIVVCAKCLSDSRQGRIKASGILVCVQTNHHSCLSTVLHGETTLSLANFTNFPSWAHLTRSNFNLEYRTTPDIWYPPLSGQSETFSYTVGSDTSCTQTQIATYCNGPLPTNSNIIISLVLCTQAGCAVERFPGVFSIPEPLLLPEINLTGLAVGGALCGLVVVIAACLGVALWCQDRRSNLKVMQETKRASDIPVISNNRKVSGQSRYSVSSAGTQRRRTSSGQESMEMWEGRLEPPDLVSIKSDRDSYIGAGSRRASLASVM